MGALGACGHIPRPMEASAVGSHVKPYPEVFAYNSTTKIKRSKLKFFTKLISGQWGSVYLIASTLLSILTF